MARLIIQSQEASPQVIELRPGVNRLGRGEVNDHPLNHPGISDHHCEITVGNGPVLVRDLGSTNGTFVDHQPVSESELRPGQLLKVGALVMLFDDPPDHLAIPEMPALPNPFEVSTTQLKDGHAACLNHGGRHAVWDCPHCTRTFCDECVRKLRRVGGAYLRFCPVCSRQCRLSAWAESVKNRKRSFFSSIADKLKTHFKKTRLSLISVKSEKPDKSAHEEK